MYILPRHLKILNDLDLIKQNFNRKIVSLYF
jgi:hypothetical protein